ncbi:MAG TPA: low specificity L-threonine aldolase [Solirubrobacterales bacterium]|nr:low specificity L-threonine aldolase [Solirubrobacterales bacterium]
MSAQPASPHDFASDNHAGAHAEVIEALIAANAGHAGAYGTDAWTARLAQRIEELFGPGAITIPVFGGTGANVLCLELMCRPHEAVICTTDAHINLDECGAPERITGVKLLTVEGEGGKLRADDVTNWEAQRGVEHHVQPRVVSITQCTELGTVYTPQEIRAIADAAHEQGMYVHMDGARLANAAAHLGVSLAAISSEAGVDAVSFGGTKNGLLYGELVVLLDGIDADRTAFARKQLMQLASKMRFVSTQFEALLADELWLRSATHANAMATLLAERLDPAEGAVLAHPVESNAVFVRLSAPAIAELLSRLEGEPPFHVWDRDRGVVRLMCSWDTTPEDVERLAEAVREVLAG